MSDNRHVRTQREPRAHIDCRKKHDKGIIGAKRIPLLAAVVHTSFGAACTSHVHH